MNIFDPIEKVAHDAPHRPAIVTGSNDIGFAALLRLTSVVANRFAQTGVAPGDVVMISCPSPIANWILTLSLARLGAVSMAVPAGRPLGELIRRCAVAAVVLPDATRADDIALDVQVLSAPMLLAPGSRQETVFETRSVAPGAGWRIALSSGTSGDAKAMLWSHGAALAAWQSNLPVYPLTHADRVLVFMDMGINFAVNQSLRVLGCGATLVLPSKAQRGELARCIDHYGATQVITVTSLAVELVYFLQQQGWQGGLRFPSLNHFIAGGETMSLAVQRKLRQQVCANLGINYGSSEAGLIARADVGLMDQYPHAVGRLLPQVQAQALDPLGQPLAAGEPGLLRFRAPGMASAYVGEQELSRQSFRDGWYHSRDMGSVTQDGVLTLGARSEERLQWAQRLLDPQPIEATLLALPGMTEAVVIVGRDAQDQPALIALYVATRALDPAVLRQHCLERLEPALVPQQLVQVAKIPRTSGGKVSRRQLGLRVKLGDRPDAATAAAR